MATTEMWDEGVLVYYYTPLPLNLANKQASKQATSKQASNPSPFRFGYCFASSLRALLYSKHLGA